MASISSHFIYYLTMSLDSPHKKFQSTHWTLIERAVSSDKKEADQALTIIFQSYWPPLYVFARYKGLSVEDAEDVVQKFFSDLCEKGLLEKACPEKGKLRTFFLTVVERLILQKTRGDLAQKRGGGQTTFSIDQAREEKWINSEPLENKNPESIFDKRWALAVLEQALLALREEYLKKDNASLFDSLKSHLGWSEGEDSYENIARNHQMTEGAVRVAVYRLRKKYKGALETQIAETIGSANKELIREEIEHLFAAIASG